MALDPNYILASDLMGVFRDKDTAEPLAGGLIYLYEDDQRNTLKPVYQLSGAPPYGQANYTVLPNPLVLASDGTYQDAYGNSIVPYWYPFDSNGTLDLYYVVCYSAGGVLQFTRSAWPNVTSQDISSLDETNFIPNGQFLAHNDHQVTATSGGVTSSYIAQGGWTTEISSGTGGSYTATFSQLTTKPSALHDFPRYICKFKCITPGLETRRDLAIKWNNVNQFENGTNTIPVGTQIYTLSFAANANTSPANFELVLVKYFGTGGSPSTVSPQVISSGTLATGWNYYTYQITFGSNAGYTVGTNNDDYVQLAIRPQNSAFDIDFTDFMLVVGSLTNLQTFLPMTNAQMLSQGVAGWMPAPASDGSDLYLPLVLTPQGMTFDHSIVGQIVGKTQSTVVNNELFMDGSTYLYSGYSSLGIPYKRLADYLIANSPQVTIGTSTIPIATIPMYGTGANFVTVLNNTDPTKFDLNMNTSSGSNAVSNGTSGFTHTSADPLYVFTVTGVPTAGLYFSFTPNTGGALVYNAWFSVDGSGTAPVSPTGANIEIKLVTGDTVATTITKIVKAINQYQFMLSDLRGYFLRGDGSGVSVDPDAASRTVPGISDNGTPLTGAYLASVQSSAFASHNHTYTLSGLTAAPPNQILAGNSSQLSTSSQNTGNAGASTETRPVNYYVNWFIKY